MVESGPATDQQRAFVETLPGALRRAGKDMAAVVKHFHRDGLTKPSTQAIYKWPKTGRISDQYLKDLADFLDCDYAVARTTGALVLKKIAPQKSPENGTDVPALIHFKVRKLDRSAQLQLLSLIETMINIADPRYWQYIDNMREPEQEPEVP